MTLRLKQKSTFGSGMNLIIDVRERGLLTELERVGAKVSAAALDVGDILIQNTVGDPMLVIERKTLADFAASNTDGRYREQRARLMAVRGSGVAVAYILEGSWGSSVNEYQLRRLTSRLTLRYGMPVFYSETLEQTARWCVVLQAQLAEDPTVFHPEGLAAETASAMTAYTSLFSATKKANKGCSGVAQGMLSAIPGLGGKKVTAILEGGHSIASLASKTVAELAEIKVGGKRLGEKLGKLIAEALHFSETLTP